METKIKREGNKYVVNLEVARDEWDKEQDAAFRSISGKFRVQGFRPGKAPRSVVEKQYGADVFAEEAMNRLLSRVYARILSENPNIRPIDRPDIDLKGDTKDGGVGFVISVDVQPEFTLGQYTDIEIKKGVATVADGEVDDFLATQSKMRMRQIATGKEHKIANGDIAVIDFTGSIGGVEFDGGKGVNHELEIGSKSFIDGFEEQLVGHSDGDHVEVNVTFPEKYHAENLAGKEALFVVDIKNVLRREFPEINDVFAKEASEFDNLSDWKNDIRRKLEVNAIARVESEVRNELLKQIIEGTKVDIPEKMIQMKLGEIMEDMRMQLAQQGATIEMYAQYIKQPVEKIMESQRENAVKATKAHLVLNAIIAKEAIEVTDQEINSKVDEIAAQYDPKAAKKFKDATNLEYIREDLRFEKLIKWLLANNNII